ncbi:single-strand binding family protein [Bifidobacterium actinocoloniiforme DSM 22766]|uniref:Single-stranded DNA-binding protein n=1 Tax=Bifidobacterium actinocoloniiforme DSM 22766 TaxID=1437605 RepID=A0A086YZW4_9BIFI|nr:single-strand binding family protein [Bifidobacterium actinocoloniiforme DSM 22766]
MSNETTLTIRGNLTADPELRSTGSGKRVANFTIASTPRTFNRQSKEWEDGPTLFQRCTAWGDLAEHISQSLRKGSAALAVGRLSQRDYQAKDGSTRTVTELTVDDIGPSLVRATAQVTRTQGASGFQGHTAQPGQEFGGDDDQPEF